MRTVVNRKYKILVKRYVVISDSIFSPGCHDPLLPSLDVNINRPVQAVYPAALVVTVKLVLHHRKISDYGHRRKQQQRTKQH